MQGVEKIVESLLDATLSTWTHYMYHMKASMQVLPSYQRYTEYCAAKYFTLNRYMKCRTKYKDAYVGVEK